jgi:M6 family metalloprotease-like protein
MRHLPFLLGATFLFATMTCTSLSDAQTAADFGYESRKVTGKRKLLTILVDFADVKIPSSFTKDYYRQLLFGIEVGYSRNQPKVAGEGGYFHYASNFMFQFENAGIVGPFTNIDNPATTGDESLHSCLVVNNAKTCSTGPDTGSFTHFGNALVAAASQVNFAQFDTNGDGIVKSDELTVLILEATPAGSAGGATRDTDPRTIILPTGLKLELRAAAIKHNGDTEVMIHELTHAIGIAGAEPYGASAMVNRNYAMMSSVAGADNGRHTVLYDPFHRMALGWVQPTLIDATQSTTVNIVAANDAQGRVDRAFVLHNPARGTREFFMLEYRMKKDARDFATPSDWVELHNLWSAVETNNMATTSPDLNGVPGSPSFHEQRHFRYVRSEGWVLNPAQTRPADMVTLYAWRNESRKDDFVTSDPNWSGGPGAVRSGYTFVAKLGYVYANDRPGAVPLYSWWNATTQDNFITSNPYWAGNAGDVRDGYSFIRREGYIPWSPDINYDDDPFNRGDTTLPDEGLAIWHLRIDPSTNWLQVFAEQPVSPDKRALTRWWSDSRGDNFDTTTWPATKTVPPLDYVHGAEIGRIFTTAASGRVPLYSWFSDSRGDNLSTTNPLWAGTTVGQMKDGYRYVGIEGYLYSPTATVSDQDVVPMYSYWNAARGDNMLSSETSVSGYSSVRLEGFVHKPRSDAGLYIVPPSLIEGRPAHNGLWTQADGVATVRFFDGTTAFTARVLSSSTSHRTLQVQIN